MKRPASQAACTNNQVMKRPAGQRKSTFQPMRSPVSQMHVVETPKSETGIQEKQLIPDAMPPVPQETSRSETGIQEKQPMPDAMPPAAPAVEESTRPQESMCAEEGQSTPVLLKVVPATARPCVHLFNPCSAMELSERHGRWKVASGPGSTWTGPDGVGNFCSPGVHHHSMDSAPAIAQEVAKEVRAHFAGGQLQLVNIGNNYDSTDEVIVVTNPGGNPEEWPVEGILRALGVRREDLRFSNEDFWMGAEELMRMAAPGSGFDVWGQAEIEEKDWSKDVIGYSFDRKDFQEGDVGWAKIIAITDVMAKRLTRHFQFSMSTRVECMQAPMIWGGFASDGSIVGVLGTFLNR